MRAVVLWVVFSLVLIHIGADEGSFNPYLQLMWSLEGREVVKCVDI